MTIVDVMSYLFAEVSQQIYNLKAEAYQATEHEKYAYVSSDGKSFRNDRPPDTIMSEGWVFGKVKFKRTQSHMNPKHKDWPVYQQRKRYANALMAARLILKAGKITIISGFNSDGLPVDKSEVSLLIPFLYSQAKGRNEQKSLSAKAYRLLTKMNNRLKAHPERFAVVEDWLKEKEASREVVHSS